jgi:hypothetical protein
VDFGKARPQGLREGLLDFRRDESTSSRSWMWTLSFKLKLVSSKSTHGAPGEISAFDNDSAHSLNGESSEAGRLQRIGREETEDYLRKPLGSRGVEPMVEHHI